MHTFTQQGKKISGTLAWTYTIQVSRLNIFEPISTCLHSCENIDSLNDDFQSS